MQKPHTLTAAPDAPMPIVSQADSAAPDADLIAVAGERKPAQVRIIQYERNRHVLDLLLPFKKP